MSPQIDCSMGDWRIFYSFRESSASTLRSRAGQCAGEADRFSGLDARITPITIVARALGSDTAERPSQARASKTPSFRNCMHERSRTQRALNKLVRRAKSFHSFLPPSPSLKNSRLRIALHLNDARCAMRGSPSYGGPFHHFTNRPARHQMKVREGET